MRYKGSDKSLPQIATELGVDGVVEGTVMRGYTLIGETDEAFAWLERGYREHDSLIVQLKANPLLDPLRADPRFQDLLRRIGFPES